MPLDRATMRWDETVSPQIHVATLTIPQQDIDARGQTAYGENLSFNPWRALLEHMPVGSIAQARKVVYAAAELRRNPNGVPLGEPVEPRPSQNTATQPCDMKIVRAAIHPAIGVARVGNSPEEYFLGPETLVPPRMPARSNDRPRGSEYMDTMPRAKSSGS